LFSVVGPFNQGTELTLICESGGGKPIPQVYFYTIKLEIGTDKTEKPHLNIIDKPSFLSVLMRHNRL